MLFLVITQYALHSSTMPPYIIPASTQPYNTFPATTQQYNTFPATTQPPSTSETTSPPYFTTSAPAPSVTLTPSFTSVMGSDVSLNCSSDLSGTFMWTHSSGSYLLSDPNIVISSSSMESALTISSIQTSHAGTYTCTVNTGQVSNSQNSTVTVQCKLVHMLIR